MIQRKEYCSLKTCWLEDQKYFVLLLFVGLGVSYLFWDQELNMDWGTCLHVANLALYLRPHVPRAVWGEAFEASNYHLIFYHQDFSSTSLSSDSSLGPGVKLSTQLDENW